MVRDAGSKACHKTMRYQLQLLLQRAAQPVIRLLFHVVPSRFGQLFSLFKWRHYFKTAFCIYSGYLCLIKICLLILIIQVWHVKKEQGGKRILTPLSLYIFMCVVILWCFWLLNFMLLRFWVDRITTSNILPLFYLTRLRNCLQTISLVSEYWIEVCMGTSRWAFFKNSTVCNMNTKTQWSNWKPI